MDQPSHGRHRVGRRLLGTVPPGRGSAGWSRATDARTTTALFLVVLSVFLLTATYSGAQVNDTREASVSAWSLATRGTLALPEGWAPEMDWAKPGVDGRHYSNRFPGVIATGVPFHLVASWLGFNDPTPSHPVLVHHGAAGVAAASVSAVFIALLFVLFRTLADRRTALLAALIAAFGTATWSVSADALWTHGVTSLWLTAGMLAMSKERSAAAGLSFACSILARPQTAVVPAVMGIWRGAARRSVRPIIIIGLTSAVGLLVMSVYSYMVFGTWLPVAGYNPTHVSNVATGAGRSLLMDLVNTLGHPRRGVLLFTPFLIVLLPAIGWGWRAAPDWVRSAAVAGGLYLVVQLRANAWDGGRDFYGSRLTIEALVLLSPLLLRTYLEVFQRREALRWVVIVAAGASIVVHGFGAITHDISPRARDRWEHRVATACEDQPEAQVCRGVVGSDDGSMRPWSDDAGS